MTLDEVLDGLFPSGHDVQADAAGIIIGTGKRKQGGAIAVVGVANGVALGTAGVLPLAQEVLRVVADGGKNRRLLGGADAFAEDSMEGFRAVAIALIAKVPAFDLKTMLAEQQRLAARQEKLGACDDAVSMWRVLGIKDPEAIRDMDSKDFAELASSIKEANHDAR